MCRITELIIRRASIWPANGFEVRLHGRRGPHAEWTPRYSPAQLEELARIDAEIEGLRHAIPSPGQA